MMRSTSTVGPFSSRSEVSPDSSVSMMEVPALSTSALKNTIRLSARRPVCWTLVPVASAVSSSSSQVSGIGWSPTCDSRYQSSRVLLFSGAPYCVPA